MASRKGGPDRRAAKPSSKDQAEATAEAGGGAEPSLKRERAGLYKTSEGRFSVEQESGQWLVVDTEQLDELGLPMVRGPFGSLNEARGAIVDIRSRPKPASPLAARLEETARETPARERARDRKEGRRGAAREAEPRLEVVPPAPVPRPPLEVRELGTGDGAILERLAQDDAEFEEGLSGRSSASSAGSARSARKPLPDRSAAKALLDRDFAHLLVAVEGDQPIGFVLAYELPGRHEDETKLLIDELAVRAGRRREGVGTKLVEALCAIARQRNIRQALVLTRESNEPAMAFFARLGGRRQARDEVAFAFEILAR